ncbi:MAG: hypothetical protein R3C02_01970 [Planctomycetaceae bacterium]
MLDRQGLLVGDFEESRQSQIGKFDHAFLVDQQIGRLDVSAHQTVFVGMAISFRLPLTMYQWFRFNNWELAFFGESFLEALPDDVFHHQEMNFGPGFILLTDVISTYDIRVIKCSNGFGLSMKSSEVRRIFHPMCGKDFDGTTAFHHDMLGQINRAHLSAPDMIQ